MMSTFAIPNVLFKMLFWQSSYVMEKKKKYSLAVTVQEGLGNGN